MIESFEDGHDTDGSNPSQQSGVQKTSSLETPSSNNATQKGDDVGVETIDRLSKQVTDIERKLDDFHRLLENEQSLNVQKGELVRRLFDKLRDYEQDFIFNKILKRVFTDLIRLYDRVNGIRADLASDNEISEQVLQHLESIRAEVLRALKRNDIYLNDQTRPKFDERYQEAVAIRSVETTDEDMNVLEIVQDGFNYQDKVFRAARVVVGKFEKVDTGGANG